MRWPRLPEDHRGRPDWELVFGWFLVLSMVLILVALFSGCAMPEYETDHWRDAVRNERGLIRGS